MHRILQYMFWLSKVNSMCQMTLMMTINAVIRLLLLRRRRLNQLQANYLSKCRVARRRKMIRLLLALPRIRRAGILKHRSGHWWHEDVPLFSDNDWLENFRMRKSTFDWICLQLNDRLKPQPQQVIEGHALHVEKIVAVALFKIASVAEYRVVGNLFGVCKATVHNCIRAFCYAIIDVLGKHTIKFPDSEEATDISSCFEKMCGIPQVIGAIDGSHIPICPPREGRADYHNRKGFHSLVLQAIVDHQYLFRDVSCQLPGSSHDVDVLKESYFYQNREEMMPKGVKSVDGKDIPFMLLGDPAYPLQPWLLKNYQYDKNISPFMDSFNVYLNKGRVVVENAFGRLKGRWRSIGVYNHMDHTFIPVLVGACCILHNICEISKDSFKDTWTKSLRQHDGYVEELNNVPYYLEDSYDAKDCRDHLMLYLSERCELLSSCRGRITMDK